MPQEEPNQIYYSKNLHPHQPFMTQVTHPWVMQYIVQLYRASPFFGLIFRMMHDEVSDTENIRKNLAIERMIVEGCDILLDTSQTFIRQGESHRAFSPSTGSTALACQYTVLDHL